MAQPLAQPQLLWALGFVHFYLQFLVLDKINVVIHEHLKSLWSWSGSMMKFFFFPILPDF